MKDLMSFRKFLTFIFLLLLMLPAFSAEKKLIGKFNKYQYIDRFSFQLGRGYPNYPQYDREIPAMGFLIFRADNITEYTVEWKYAYIAPLEFSTFCPVFGSCGGGLITGVKIPLSKLNKMNELRLGLRIGFSPVYFLFDITPQIMFFHYFKPDSWYYGIGVNTHLMFLDSMDVVCVFVYFKTGF